MTVRVITPPAPIVTPGDVPGDHAADDVAVLRAIEAATRTIDGPTGWLGRTLGPQTLELSGWFCERSVRLPYPPVMEIVSVITEDCAGIEETADPSTYRLDGRHLIVGAGADWVRRHKHRISYRAGYDGISVADGGTGLVPPEAIEAIIILVQDRMRLSDLGVGIRSESVEGVGDTTYLDADRFSDLARRAAFDLLDGLRLFA